MPDLLDCQGMKFEHVMNEGAIPSTQTLQIVSTLFSSLEVFNPGLCGVGDKRVGSY